MKYYLRNYKIILRLVTYSLMLSTNLYCRKDDTMIKHNDYRMFREKMVTEQIINRLINDTAVIRSMRNVERHKFVSDEFKKLAYEDTPLPIGYGQTISQPYIVAYMTESLQPKSNYKVLEIGTGSGYQAAVLAEIVDSVFTIEIISGLGKRAEQILDSLGYKNVIVKIGDGYNGWIEHAPYDAIVVTAAFDSIPPSLIEQLKDGGKLVMPVGSTNEVQVLKLLEKNGDEIIMKELLPVRFVPLKRDTKEEDENN